MNAPGLEIFRNKIIAFPNGKYDDQVDSMVQLLKHSLRAVQLAQQFKRPIRKALRSKRDLPASRRLGVNMFERLHREI